jgi:predicted phosphoadenosine phosphosulfate sulfurtransferase
MTTEELAKKIYNHVLSLSTRSEHWDEWDDKREIEWIKNLIETNHKSPTTTELPKFKDEWGESDWRDTGEMGG